MSKTKRIKKEKEFINQIETIIEPINGQLISFEKLNKEFGNMMVKIEINDEVHIYIADKGQIYHNDKQMFDGSYHEEGVDDTPIYLIKAIKKTLGM
ncbi:MAG: hypothetical protein K8Q99_08220 [Acholeplasmataceae bacterium]|nr:hypothetical protein [Acholeplasmataceae bacterium]